jgi:hypothetical protein
MILSVHDLLLLDHISAFTKHVDGLASSDHDDCPQSTWTLIVARKNKFFTLVKIPQWPYLLRRNPIIVFFISFSFLISWTLQNIDMYS